MTGKHVCNGLWTGKSPVASVLTLKSGTESIERQIWLSVSYHQNEGDITYALHLLPKTFLYPHPIALLTSHPDSPPSRSPNLPPTRRHQHKPLHPTRPFRHLRRPRTRTIPFPQNHRRDPASTRAGRGIDSCKQLCCEGTREDERGVDGVVW